MAEIKGIHSLHLPKLSYLLNEEFCLSQNYQTTNFLQDEDILCLGIQPNLQDHHLLEPCSLIQAVYFIHINSTTSVIYLQYLQTLLEPEFQDCRIL